MSRRKKSRHAPATALYQNFYATQVVRHFLVAKSGEVEYQIRDTLVKYPKTKDTKGSFLSPPRGDTMTTLFHSAWPA